MRFAWLAVPLFAAGVFAQETGVQSASVSAPLPRITTQEEVHRGVVSKEREGEAEGAYRYAAEAMGSGYLSRALELYSDFLIRFPGHDRTFDVRRDTGEILRRKGRILEAANADLYTCRLFSQEERGFDLCLRSARLFLRMGQSDRARAIFQEIMQKYPASVPARIAATELSLLPENSVSEPGKEPERPTSEQRVENRSEDEMPGEGVFDANSP